MKKKSGIYLDILSHVLLVGATIVAVFPLVWIIISSVKGKGELTQYPTRFWPEQFTLDYFTHVINDLHFIDNIRNSLIIALGYNPYCDYYFCYGSLWYCSILS